MPLPRLPETDLEVRQAIIAASLAMNARGLSHGCSGNISARWGDGFLITPSGVPYAHLAPADIALVTPDGAWVGPLKPSSEWRMHRDLYAARPDFSAVVHTHSVHATTLACLNEPLPAVHYMIAAAGVAEIPCAAYATFGSQALSDNLLAALGAGRACLLAHHGLIAGGATISAALDLAAEIEFVAQIWCQARMLGRPAPLGDAEMVRVLDAFTRYGVQDDPA